MTLMETQDGLPQFLHSRLAAYSALLTSILTLVTFGIAIATPPLSGPWCTGSCFTYPYADIAERFPRDYYWMYAALLQLIAYAVLLTCIHDYAHREKKLYSLLGLCSGLIAATVLFADYFVQLSVIQPSLLAGETDGIALLTQFNAHGIFIVVEELGYLLMGVACLPLAMVFSGKGYIEKSIRWIFLGGFILTVFSFIAILFAYGLQREYRFEIASISINWIVLIVSGFLLYVLFTKLIPPKQ
jgi:hypothetical protein